MIKYNLEDIGFDKDPIQTNHWNNGDFLLYKNLTDEYVLATFDSDGGIDIIEQKDNIQLMKEHLLYVFKFEFRENRLSKILD